MDGEDEQRRSEDRQGRGERGRLLYRGYRIGQLVESLGPHDRSTFSRMHTDAHVAEAMGIAA